MDNIKHYLECFQEVIICVLFGLVDYGNKPRIS